MCFKLDYFQLEYIYITSLKTRIFLKRFIYICIYIYVCVCIRVMVIIITKQKFDFKNGTYSTMHISKMTVILFVSLTPWHGITAKLKALVFSCSDLTMDFFFLIKNLTTCWVNTNSVKYMTFCILCWVHTKMGDIKWCSLRGLFTIEIDGDDILVSQNVCGWLVAIGIFQESHQDSHLIGRSSAVLIWFPSLRIISIPSCCVVI